MDLRFYKRLARDGVKGAAHLVKALDWNPDQERDADGKFGSGGGGHSGSAGNGPGERAATEKANAASNRNSDLINHGGSAVEIAKSHGEAAQAHREAAKLATTPAQKSGHETMAAHHSESLSRMVGAAKQAKAERGNANIKDPWANTMELLK